MVVRRAGNSYRDKKSKEAAPLTDPRDPTNSVAEARIRLQNIAEGQVSSKFLNMMKDSLPRKSQMKLKGDRGTGTRRTSATFHACMPDNYLHILCAQISGMHQLRFTHACTTGT